MRFSRPGDGSRGTMTSLNSISKAAVRIYSSRGAEREPFTTLAEAGGGGASNGRDGRLVSSPPVNQGRFLKLVANGPCTSPLFAWEIQVLKEAPERPVATSGGDGGIAADDAPEYG